MQKNKILAIILCIFSLSGPAAYAGENKDDDIASFFPPRHHENSSDADAEKMNYYISNITDGGLVALALLISKASSKAIKEETANTEELASLADRAKALIRNLEMAEQESRGASISIAGAEKGRDRVRDAERALGRGDLGLDRDAELLDRAAKQFASTAGESYTEARRALTQFLTENYDKLINLGFSETDIREINAYRASAAGAKVLKIEVSSLHSIKSSIKSLRIVRAIMRVGGVLFLMDLSSRIYIWNVLDRNPKLLSLIPVTKNLAHKLFNLGDGPEYK